MPRSRAAIALTIAASFMLVLAFTQVASAAVVVKATANQTFSPHKLRVHHGTKVVWKNPSSSYLTHTVTAWHGNWSKNTTIHPGDSTSFTFHHTGTFKYYCTIHGNVSGGSCTGMCGVVKVT